MTKQFNWSQEIERVKGSVEQRVLSLSSTAVQARGAPKLVAVHHGYRSDQPGVPAAVENDAIEALIAMLVAKVAQHADRPWYATHARVPVEVSLTGLYTVVVKDGVAAEVLRPKHEQDRTEKTLSLRVLFYSC